MSDFHPTLLSAILAVGLGSNALQAQNLSNSDATINRALCVGEGCPDDPTGTFIDNFAASVTLRSNRTRIDFDDSSVGGFPANDWSLIANDNSSGGLNYLAIRDITGGTTPFTVLAGAPENAIYVAGDGKVGIGTNLPTTDLHVVSSGTSARLRLEKIVGTPQAYELRSTSNDGFNIVDTTAGRFPFVIRPGAPNLSIGINSNGDIGFGTNSPEGKLHTKGIGVQLAYFESTDGNAVQVRFRTDSENRRFLAVNNANEVKSQIVFGDDQITFLGQTVANEWLRISDAGIVSSGPTCNPNPCDATFDPDVFTVPPIEERAALMWQNMHLPAVGPTVPGEPFNLTEKTAGMLHELEVAHIYIEGLNTRLTAQERQLEHQEAEKAALITRLEQQEKRLETLEAALHATTNATD